MRARRAAALCLALGACDGLYFGAPPQKDAGVSADGGAGVLVVQVCALLQLGDYRSCSVTFPHGPIQVKVLETGDQGDTDSSGRLQLTLRAGAPSLLTLAAVDAGGKLQAALVPASRPAAGTTPTLALPMVTAEAYAQLRLLGLPLSAGRGALLGYVVNASGAPLASVAARLDLGGRGPFYDGGLGLLVEGGRTGELGLVAFFEVPPGTAQLTLTGARQNLYALPVAAGAVTFSLLP